MYYVVLLECSIPHEVSGRISNAMVHVMNVARATEFWSHYLGHFVSVLPCRVCACGSYGGGDVHK